MKPVPIFPLAAFFLGTLALIAAFPGHAAGDYSGGDLVYQPCAACHGAEGLGNPQLGAPALAGQQAAYIARQLQHFRSGIRSAAPGDAQAAQMVAMAASLPDEAAIDKVAVYLAGLPPPPTAEQPPAGDLRNGKNQYNGACGACHGARGEGNKALNAPRLAGLDTGYLERQFRQFRNGQRGAHPDDRFGRQMAMMAGTLREDKDLADVLAFIATQPTGDR